MAPVPAYSWLGTIVGAVYNAGMANRSSSNKRPRPRDVNQLAHSIVEEATGQAAPAPAVVPAEGESQKDPAAVSLGRRGGLKGGPARAKKLTAEERSRISRSGALARWKRKEGTQ
jgi:hypothetical protein